MGTIFNYTLVLKSFENLLFNGFKSLEGTLTYLLGP
jgi:hypothetical protein